MSIGNTKDQGNKGNNFPYQLRTLQLLSSINDGIAALPGVDYETRTSTYQAICTICGPGYSTGDIIIRYDIIDVATQTLAAEMWFNQTTQGVISPAPAPGDLTPISAPSGVTVLNGPLGAAVNIQDGGNSITVDAIALDIRTLTFATDKVDVSGSSVKLQDGSGNNITSTANALDVNIKSGITLDVNLDKTNDTVQVYGSDLTAPIATNSLGQLQVDILTLPALTFATDKVDVSGSNVNAVVTATDLDIRNLTFVDDKVDVSGSSISATQSGTWNINDISGTISLPTGAATEATLATRLADATFTTRINTLGQKVMADSTPVVLASDQSTLNVTQVERTGVSGFTGAITGVAATDVIAAPGIGLFTYITQILVTNSHATVGTLVTIQTEDGTGLYTGYAGPAGGGFSISFSVPIKMPVANKKLQAICGTTGANVYVSASGYRAA